MACSEDQEQSKFKHFCKICRKGFMCGSALGGHMRAHGVEDESIWSIEDDEDLASDWEDKDEGSDKKMYVLRTNPNRLKSCKICENCGKEFSSWKSFLEHGKCSCEDVDEELPVSSPSPIPQNEEEFGEKKICGWSKRKRSFRAKVGSVEDLALAKCLTSLSNAIVDPSDTVPEESYAYVNTDVEQRNAVKAFLAPLTRSLAFDKASGVAAKGLFECNTCKKVFTSHQALGGHRASHKKVKGCFATQGNQFDDSFVEDDVIIHDDFLPSKSHISMQYDHGPRVPLAGTSRFKSRVHECSICHRVFSSGQALGGHKRCHWLTSNNCPKTSPLIKYHNQFQGHNNSNLNFSRPHPQPNKPNPPILNFPATVGANTAGTWWDPQNAQSFEVSTEINLQSWVDVELQDNHHLLHQQLTDHENADDKYNIKKNNNTIHTVSMQNVDDDDDAESKAKLAKISKLKDMNDNGSSSSWLQIGIGSLTGGTAANS